MSHPAFTPQPQNITVLWPVLISRPAEGRRLSWPWWFACVKTVIRPTTNWARRWVTWLIHPKPVGVHCHTCLRWQWCCHELLIATWFQLVFQDDGPFLLITQSSFDDLSARLVERDVTEHVTLEHFRPTITISGQSPPFEEVSLGDSRQKSRWNYDRIVRKAAVHVMNIYVQNILLS